MGDKENNGPVKSPSNRLIRMAQKRLGKFASAYPMVLISDRAEYIHDTRVASRRMQQVIALFFPPPRTGKSRKIVRALRKVRRALGTARNLDVNLDLIQEKIDAATSDIARDSWGQVLQAIGDRRAAELGRAREDLKRIDIVKIIDRVMALTTALDDSERAETLLKQQTDGAVAEWIDALDLAQETPQVKQIHALRIAGKRVRYSAELLVELGDGEAKAAIKQFKSLQDQVGHWHDRQILMEFIAEFISQSDFLLNHPDYGRYLLTEIEKEKQRNATHVKGILESAAKIRNHWVEQRLKNSAEKTG